MIYTKHFIKYFIKTYFKNETELKVYSKKTILDSCYFEYDDMHQLMLISIRDSKRWQQHINNKNKVNNILFKYNRINKLKNITDKYD